MNPKGLCGREGKAFESVSVWKKGNRLFCLHDQQHQQESFRRNVLEESNRSLGTNFLLRSDGTENRRRSSLGSRSKSGSRSGEEGNGGNRLHHGDCFLIVTLCYLLVRRKQPIAFVILAGFAKLRKHEEKRSAVEIHVEKIPCLVEVIKQTNDTLPLPQVTSSTRK